MKKWDTDIVALGADPTCDELRLVREVSAAKRRLLSIRFWTGNSLSQPHSSVRMRFGYRRLRVLMVREGWVVLLSESYPDPTPVRRDALADLGARGADR